ncbi:MAG: dipeptidyl carboxypeptidase II, partial [Flavobacteriales bacterium]|nr:dipeptidyl carboxypeptidase II [Flavobacteriales bacterium]
MDTRTVNPLLEASDLPFGAPRFDRIREADFRPAIEEAMSRQLAEVEAIVSAPEAPTFENTIVALERCGQDLGRAASVFYNLTGSATNDELQAIKADLAPKLAEHRDAISLNEGLFARIKDLYDRRDQLGLDPVDARLLEKHHSRFVRAGALLEGAERERMKALNAEEARLTTRFAENVLKERADMAVLVEEEAQLEGLSHATLEAAAAAAIAKGHAGKWVLDLRNTTTQPALAELKDRALRERIMRASLSRNSRGNAYDTRATLARLAQLRAVKAKLLDFPTWVHYVMDDQMAKSPDRAMELLGRLAPAAAANARKEAARLQELVDQQEGGFTVEAW